MCKLCTHTPNAVAVSQEATESDVVGLRPPLLQGDKFGRELCSDDEDDVAGRRGEGNAQGYGAEEGGQEVVGVDEEDEERAEGGEGMDEEDEETEEDEEVDEEDEERVEDEDEEWEEEEEEEVIDEEDEERDEGEEGEGGSASSENEDDL